MKMWKLEKAARPPHTLWPRGGGGLEVGGLEMGGLGMGRETKHIFHQLNTLIEEFRVIAEGPFQVTKHFLADDAQHLAPGGEGTNESGRGNCVGSGPVVRDGRAVNQGELSWVRYRPISDRLAYGTPPAAVIASRRVFDCLFCLLAQGVVGPNDQRCEQSIAVLKVLIEPRGHHLQLLCHRSKG